MIRKRKYILGIALIVLVCTVSFSLILIDLNDTEMQQNNTFERNLSVIQPDTVNYSVLGVNPSSSESTIRVEYGFDEKMDIIELNLKSKTPSLRVGLIESTGSIGNNSSTVRFYNKSTASFTYTSKIDDDLDTRLRFFGNSTSFSSWPKVEGKITQNGTRYSFSYDEEKATKKIQTEDIEEEQSGFRNLRGPQIISSMGYYMIVEDNSSSLINITRERIRTNNVNYTLINSKSIKEMRFNKLFSSSDILFDRTNKTYENTLFILPVSHLFEPYYAGATFDRDETESVLWVKSRFVSEKHYSTVAHEIVHTSQTYEMDDRTEWWIEGSASYIGSLIKMKTFEEIDKDNFMRSAFGDENTDESYPRDTRLSDPDSWIDAFNYDQGARLTYIIDREIRGETNQEKNILNLHYWMQDTNDITHNKFISKIRNWTSETFIDKVKSYMNQSNLIDINFSLDMFDTSIRPRG